MIQSANLPSLLELVLAVFGVAGPVLLLKGKDRP